MTRSVRFMAVPRLVTGLVAASAMLAGCAASADDEVSSSAGLSAPAEATDPPGGRDQLDAPPPLVVTRLGALRGQRGPDAVDRFLGVPYARPPVGDLRFKKALPVGPWRGVLDATVKRPACSQLPSSDSIKIVNEDCLHINIYRPARQLQRGRLPVLFHIHGGGFTGGTANNHDGGKIAVTDDMVVVMVEYRLNAFGFLAAPELSAEAAAAGGAASSGNFGVFDQQLALKWVHDNIAAFGGDPDNVTISGQSAGGWSVCDQIVAPGSAGLFHRAIVMSGDCTAIPLAQAEASGAAFAASRLGCADPATRLACLRGKTAEQILDATSGQSGLMSQANFSAGGDLFSAPPKQLIAAGAFNHAAVMIGTTHDEFGFIGYLIAGASVTDQASFDGFVDGFFPDRAPAIKAAYHVADFASPSAAIVAVYADGSPIIPIGGCQQPPLTRLFAAHTDTFWYEFNDRTMPIQLNLATGQPNLTPPAGVELAYHAGDLKYTVGFDTVVPLNAQQLALSDEIIRYWGAFAHTGAPRVRGQASWPRYRPSPDGKWVSFELPRSVTRTDPEFSSEHHCEVWNAPP
jgi:para-nitrobenzyl esterase